MQTMAHMVTKNTLENANN